MSKTSAHWSSMESVECDSTIAIGRSHLGLIGEEQLGRLLGNDVAVGKGETG